MTKASARWTQLRAEQLSKLVHAGVAALGDTLVRASDASQIRHVSSDAWDGDAGIELDVQVGPLTVCLFAPDWLFNKAGGPHLSEVAALFLDRVNEVYRARRRHLARYSRARSLVNAAITQSEAGMTLLSLKTASQRADCDLTGCYLMLEATIAMLDDALQPYAQRIMRWTPRELAAAARGYAVQQRGRQRALAKLRAKGALVEIDALADRAIALRGANLASCVSSLLASCDPETGLGGQIKLYEDAGGSTSLYLRAGRIMAGVVLRGTGVLSADFLIVDRVLSATVTAALAGRPGSVIVDHPFLQGIRIVSAQDWEGRQTRVRLKSPRRYLTASELGLAVPLAA